MRRTLVPAALCLAFFLAALPRVFSQRLPADATEMSRDLLYLAPQRIEERSLSESSPIMEFYAPRFTYRHTVEALTAALNDQTPQVPEWTVIPADNSADQSQPERKNKISFTLGGDDFVVSGTSDDQRATVELRREGAAEPAMSVVVWTRDQLVTAWLATLQREQKSLTAAKLHKELEVADPILYGIDSSGDSVWAAVGHSLGEGELGIGTVIRFDMKAKEAKAFQPPELATCAVTQLSVRGSDALLLGTRRQYEGTMLPCAGLVSFQPSTGKTATMAAAGSPLAGAVVTALHGGWVATDKGICSIDQASARNCWRIVPSVSLKSATPVTKRPGEKSSGDLKPGDYEVLWANQNFLEVATRDSFDAWLAGDDFAEATAGNFDAEPYKLLNSANGGPAPIRPLVKPGGDPLAGALVYRARLEKLPTPPGTPVGWVRIRARTGWIARAKLEIVPKLVPVEPRP